MGRWSDGNATAGRHPRQTSSELSEQPRNRLRTRDAGKRAIEAMAVIARVTTILPPVQIQCVVITPQTHPPQRNIPGFGRLSVDARTRPLSAFKSSKLFMNTGVGGGATRELKRRRGKVCRRKSTVSRPACMSRPVALFELPGRRPRARRRPGHIADKRGKARRSPGDSKETRSAGARPGTAWCRRRHPSRRRRS